MPFLDEEGVRLVCKDVCEAKQRGFLFGPVSVNLSRMHAGREGSSDRIRKVTAYYGIQPGELSFEITETAEKEKDETGLMEFAGQLQKEGVETEEQIRFLVENQCYLGQGYYYSRPLTKEQYIRWRGQI